jgi:hypothetical protein
VKRDGTLMALEAETILESGSFSGAVLTMSAVFIAQLYKWPSFDVKGFEVLTHKPSVAAYRAPTAPQTFFAVDSHMEQIALELWLDPSSSACATSCRKAIRWRLAALAEQWGQEVLSRLAEHRSGRTGEWAKSGNKDGHGGAGPVSAVGGWIHGSSRRCDRPPQSRRLRSACSPARWTSRDEHRAGPDRRLGLRHGRRQGAHHHRRHRHGPRDRAQRGQQDHLHVARRCCRRRRTPAARRSRLPPPRWKRPSTTSRSRTGASWSRHAGSVDHARQKRKKGNLYMSKVPPCSV